MCTLDRKTKQEKNVGTTAACHRPRDAPVEKNEKPPPQQNSKIPSVVLSQLEEIKTQMAALKDLTAEVSQIRESIQQPHYMPSQNPPAGGADSTPGPQFPSQPKSQFLSIKSWMNFSCQQSGAEDYCTHCFRCGSSKHFLAGCRARERRQLPLNGERSFTRDRERPVTQ